MGNEKIYRLLEAAWPDGVPREQLAIAAGLSVERAEIASVRLKALLAYEGGNGNWARRSRDAGLDRASFFALASEWRAERSLASIVPHVRAYRTAPRRREDVEAMVRDALRAQPDASRRRVAESVRARMAEPAGLTTIEGVVDAVRLELERDELGGAKGFGRLVVVDTCPARMRIGDPGADADYAVAWTGLVVDVASGLVIGASASEHPFGALGTACRRAAIRVEALTANTSAVPRLEVHVRGDAMAKLRETSRLLALGAEVHVSTGQRSESSRVAALLGRRFGPVTLKLRLEVPDAVHPAEPGGMSHAQMIDARVEAEAHRLWELTREDAPIPATSPRRLARMLRSVAGDGNEEG